MRLNSSELLGFIERIEPLQGDIEAAKDDIKVVMAEAKAAGFNPKGIRLCLKVRALKPQEFHDGEQLRDLYLHGIGMAETPPLFRMLETMSAESLGRTELIERFKGLVPANGEIVLTLAGAPPVRLWRDVDGGAHAEEVALPPPPDAPSSAPAAPRAAPARARAEVPDCDADGAEQLGHAAAKENKPIIANPFPFGDARRPRWDMGWRGGAGNDGMGPDE